MPVETLTVGIVVKEAGHGYNQEAGDKAHIDLAIRLVSGGAHGGCERPIGPGPQCVAKALSQSIGELQRVVQPMMMA